jgi:hypothetical protein
MIYQRGRATYVVHSQIRFALKPFRGRHCRNAPLSFEETGSFRRTFRFDEGARGID